MTEKLIVGVFHNVLQSGPRSIKSSPDTKSQKTFDAPAVISSSKPPPHADCMSLATIMAQYAVCSTASFRP